MPQGLTGISTNTASHFLLDAGQAYANIDVTLLETAGTNAWTNAITATNALSLGATRGGSSFNPGRTLREIPVDGSIGPVKGHIRRQESRPTLTLNLIEITLAQLQRSLAGQATTTTGSFSRIVGGPIAASSYLTNVAIATTFTGNTSLPVVILLRDPIVMEAPEVSFTDEDETVISVTFTGTVLAGTPNTEAWAIYHPGVTPP
jgi:hypothetical protein